MRVGFLGTGEITAAMVRGLKGQGHRILVSPRNAAMAATLAAEVPEVAIALNEQVVEGSDVVFLCLLARVAAEVLPSLPFRAGQSVISVMVDAPIATLRQLCAPVTDIAITIPLPPITTGGCPLPVYPASPALDALFGEKNLILPQPSEVASTPISAPRPSARRSSTNSSLRPNGWPVTPATPPLPRPISPP